MFSSSRSFGEREREYGVKDDWNLHRPCSVAGSWSLSATTRELNKTNLREDIISYPIPQERRQNLASNRNGGPQ